MYGIKTRGLSGTFAPIYQELQVEAVQLTIFGAVTPPPPIVSGGQASCVAVRGLARARRDRNHAFASLTSAATPIDRTQTGSLTRLDRFDPGFCELRSVSD